MGSIRDYRNLIFIRTDAVLMSTTKLTKMQATLPNPASSPIFT